MDIEQFKRVYWTMVAENLELDELEYELVIRSIEDIDNMSTSKKRRVLMKALVSEREKEIFRVRYLKSDVNEEIEVCESKLNEHLDNIRSNRGIPEALAYRLIHLGYRLINLSNTSMVTPSENVRISALVSQFSILMANILGSEAAGGNDELGDEESFSPGGKLAESTFQEDLIGQKRRPANSPLSNRGHRKQAREDEVTDITDADIANAITKLKELRMEYQLQTGQTKYRRESNPPAKNRNETNPFIEVDEHRASTGAIPKKSSQSQVKPREYVQFIQKDGDPNSFTIPNKVSGKQNPFRQSTKTTSNTVFEQKNPFELNAWPRPVTVNPASYPSEHDNNPMPPNQQELRSFSDPRLATNPTYFVKKLPVSSWKIRYAGDDQGMQLNDFLWEVHHHVMAEQTTEQELLRSAYHLFTGLAKEWYIRNFYSFTSWTEVITGLRQEFSHPDLDFAIRMQVYSRKQQRNESFKAFYSDILRKSRGLADPFTDDELIATVCRNVRPDFRKSLMLVQINSRKELEMWGNKLDSLTPILWQTSQTNTLSSENDELQNRISQHKWRDPDRRNSVGQTRSETQAHDHSFKMGQVKPPLSKDRYGPDKKSQEYVNQYKPPGRGICFNCRETGHIAKECESRRRRYCWKCGLEGEQTKDCRYCSKNGNRTA